LDGFAFGFGVCFDLSKGSMLDLENAFCILIENGDIKAPLKNLRKCMEDLI
jgi:hypothetical protein